MKFICMLSVLSLLGCDKESLSPGDLKISVSSGVLQLENRFSQTIYYFIVERNTEATINWIASVTEQTPHLKPKKSAEISLNDVLGYDDNSEEVIVFYWVAVKKGGTRVPGKINSQVIAI